MRRVPGLVSRVPGLVSRVPGLLEPCLPSLCFFLWSIRVSGLHQGSGILGLLFPFIVFLLVRDLFPGFRDFWNFVSHHCFCFVVHQGAGLHQGSGILGLLSPIIVFFLVVYQGSGIFGTLSPIIVFVLWSIRARDFIRVPGFLDFRSGCFRVPGLVSRVSGLVSRVPGLLEPCLPSLCFLVHQGFGLHQGSGIPHHCDLSPEFAGLVSRVPGLLEPCLPSLCFFLWFIRAPGFLEICLPSLCLFCGPSGRGTSSGFRDSWTFVSHHCVFSCGLSGLRDFWNLVSHHQVLWSIRARDFIRVPGFLDFCLPSLCFFLWFIRAPGFLEIVSHHCVCSVVHQGAGLHQGSGILGLLSPIIVFFLVVYQGSGIFGTLSPIIVFVLWSIRARDFIRVPGFLDFCFPSLCFFWFRDLSPEFQDLSPGFRDLWNLVSHHCVFSCGL